MSLYIQVIAGEVKNVWDSPPPEGQLGWSTAIEVRPDVSPHRQYYGAHRFDLTTDPIEIIYEVIDISADDRKAGMIQHEISIFQLVIQQQAQTPLEYDPTVIETAKQKMIARQALLETAITHDDLDTMME